MNMKFAKIIGLVMAVVLIAFFGVFIYIQKQTNPASESVTTKVENIVKPYAKTPFTFMIAGDAMMGRAVAYQFKNDMIQAFTKLGENYFGERDLSILNLEGPISAEDFPANPTANNLVFDFPPQTIDALKYLGIDAVSLGNNHSQNQGKAGLEITRQLLSAAQITPIGSQTSFDENNIKTFGNKDYQLSCIAVNFLEIQPVLTNSIKQEKAKGNLVLVFPHWGSEYQTGSHSASQEEWAHAWIDAGADMVIGSHPHVIQDAEIYQNKPIFYSLGNFIFDQTFSTETMRGLVLKGEISEGATRIEIIPIKNYHLQVGLLSGEEKDIMIGQFKDQLGQQNFIGDTLVIENRK